TIERRGGARSRTAAERALPQLANAGTRNVPGARCMPPGARVLPQRGLLLTNYRTPSRKAKRPVERSPNGGRPSRNARGVIRSMDRDTTPAATAAEPSTPPSSDGDKPKRNSSWGKVQVSPRPAAPEAPERKPAEHKPPEPRPTQPKPVEAPVVEAKPVEQAPAQTPERTQNPPSDGESTGNGSGAPRSRRSRGGRGRGGGTGAQGATTTAEDAAVETPEAQPRQPRQRQPARKPETDEAPESDARPSVEPSADGDQPSTTPKKRRRRRGGRGRGGKKLAATTADTGTDAEADGLAGETVETQRDDATP